MVFKYTACGHVTMADSKTRVAEIRAKVVRIMTGYCKSCRNGPSPGEAA